MSDTIDLNALTRTSGFDPASLAVPAKTGVVVDPAQYGPSNLAVNVTPTPTAGQPGFNPKNPLNLDLSPAGIAAIAAATRADHPPVDPDLNLSGGLTSNTNAPGVPFTSLPVDVQNAANKSLQDWGDMDQAWAKTQLQSPTPILLGALGAIAAPFALSALGVGAGLGATGAGGAAAGGAAATGAGLAGAGLGAAGAGALGAGATVSELVVTAAASGLSIPAIAAAIGIPTATAAAILANSGGGSGALQGNPGSDTLSTPAVDNSNVVEGLTVSPTAGTALDPTIPAILGGAGGIGALASGGAPPNTVDGVTVTADKPVAPTSPVSTAVPIAAAAGIGALTSAIASGDPLAVGHWIQNNPVQAAALGLGVAGALGGGATAGGGSYAIPTGNGAPGTPSSLNPIFSASLPGASTPPRVQSTLPQGIDWNRYAIQGPEQSFFSNVQSGPAQFAVPSISQIQQQGADRLGVSDLAALRKKFAGPGFARGGRMDFAVHGAGDGRSDSIPARLSDGEYVIDAETVSMLGDGSSKAGAKKLDRMRVNLRKAKGKSLARGRFSVAAKEPEAYYRGGRTDA